MKEQPVSITMYCWKAPNFKLKSNMENRVLLPHDYFFRIGTALIEQAKEGIDITQYGSTVYIGIAMVYQH